ncbi:MAG: histidine phosphatase family protein [Thermoactinomyces sp.]
METEVFLVRHGETEWNKEKRFQGHRDVPLSERGEKQAEQLAHYFKHHSFDAVYASDLLRARQTAERVANELGLPVTCLTELRERYVGEWEGLTLEEIKSKYPDWEKVRLTGGMYGVEPMEQVQARFADKCIELAKKHLGERILIVAHGLCMNVAISFLTNGEYGYDKERLQNTSITHLVYHENDGWTVKAYNATPHLPGEDTNFRL